MSRERKSLRKKVVEILKDRTDAKDNVKQCASLPIWQENLPAINVMTLSEGCVDLGEAPRTLKRTIALAIEIQADHNDEEKLAETLDDIADEVEELLAADDSLDCTVEVIVLKNVEFQFEEGGQRPTGACRLIYDAIYLSDAPRDRSGQKETDFEGVEAEWKTPDFTDDTPEITDSIEVTPP